jgi:hypothetical protein
MSYPSRLTVPLITRDGAKPAGSTLQQQSERADSVALTSQALCVPSPCRQRFDIDKR